MRKLVKYLAVTFGVCFFIILLKNEFSYKLLSKENYGMPALIENGHADNLFIGSSMFRMGLDIESIDENGQDNYILSYNGNQPVLEYYELKNLLEKNVDINTLYIDMYVYSLCAKPKISDEKMLMEIGLYDKWNLWKVISKNNTNINVKTFWQLFVNSNNELIFTWPISKGLINSRFYRGGNITKTEAASEERLKLLEMPEFEGDLNLVQFEYTKKIIFLAKSKGIQIIYIESPKYTTVAENEKYLERMTAYTELLKNEKVEYILCDKTWNAIGKPAEVMHYEYDHSDAKCFLDTVHLSYNGRVTFSKNIVGLMKNKMD